MLTWSSIGYGRSTAALVDAVITTTPPRPGPPIIYLAGVNESGREAISSPEVAKVNTTTLYATNGVVVAPTVTALWGNATAKTRIDSAVAYARTLGATNAAPVLIGASHGAATALAYAKVRSVACVVGLIPAIDIEYLRANNIASLAAGIATALGNPVQDADNPARNNPGCPVQLWYASDDTVSTNITTYATSIGADLHNVGALGHTPAAIAAVNQAQVAAFVDSYT